MFGLVADAALARPAAGAMAEAGEAALRELGAAIAAFEPLLPRLGTTLENAVGGDAEVHTGDAEELAELVEQGRAKPASPRSLIFTPGKAASRRGTRRSSMGTMRA